MGGADVCYRLSRANFLTKLVIFVDEELAKRKEYERSNSRVQGKGK